MHIKSFAWAGLMSLSLGWLTVWSNAASADIKDAKVCSELSLPASASGFDTVGLALPLDTLAAHLNWQVILVANQEARLLPLFVSDYGVLQAALPFLDTGAPQTDARLFILAKDAQQVVTFECDPHKLTLEEPPVRDGAFLQMLLRPGPSDPTLGKLEGYAEARETYLSFADEAEGSYEDATAEEKRAMDALATYMLDQPGAISGPALRNPGQPRKIHHRPTAPDLFPQRRAPTIWPDQSQAGLWQIQNTSEPLQAQPAIYRPDQSEARVWKAQQLSDAVQIITLAELEECPINGQELEDITGILAQANLRSEAAGPYDAFDKNNLKKLEVLLISTGVGLATGNANAAKATATSLDTYLTIQDTMDNIIRGTVPTIYTKMDGYLTRQAIFENSPVAFRTAVAEDITLHTRSTGFSISKIAIDTFLTIVGTVGFEKLIPKKLRDGFADELAGEALKPKVWQKDLVGAEQLAEQASRLRKLQNMPDSAVHPEVVRYLYDNPFGQSYVVKDDAAFQAVYDKFKYDPEGDIKGRIKGQRTKIVQDALQDIQNAQDPEKKKNDKKYGTNVEGYSSAPIKCQVNLTNWKHIQSKIVDLPLGNAFMKIGMKPWEHDFRAVRAGLGVVELSFYDLPDAFLEVKKTVTGSLRKRIPYLNVTIEGPETLKPGHSGFYELLVENEHPGEELRLSWSAESTRPVERGPFPVDRYFVTAPQGECRLHYVLLSVDAVSDFLEQSDIYERLPLRSISLTPDKEHEDCKEPEGEEEFYGGVWEDFERRWLEIDATRPVWCQFITEGSRHNRIDNPPGHVVARCDDMKQTSASLSHNRQVLKVQTGDTVYEFSSGRIRYAEAKINFLKAGPFPASPNPPADLFRLPEEAYQMNRANPPLYVRARRTDIPDTFGLQAVVHAGVAYVIDPVHETFSIIHRIPGVKRESASLDEFTDELEVPEDVFSNPSK